MVSICRFHAATSGGLMPFWRRSFSSMAMPSIHQVDGGGLAVDGALPRDGGIMSVRRRSLARRYAATLNFQLSLNSFSSEPSLPLNKRHIDVDHWMCAACVRRPSVSMAFFEWRDPLPAAASLAIRAVSEEALLLATDHGRGRRRP